MRGIPLPASPTVVGEENSRLDIATTVSGALYTLIFFVHTINAMDITYDSAKDAAKHGVSLAEATNIEWESALTWPDARRSYGETRWIAIGYIGLRLYVVVYTDRGKTRRIISLRKANLREIRRYAET